MEKHLLERGSACLQVLLSFGPEVCRLKAFLNFLMVLTTRYWLGNSQEKSDNNSCTLMKHKPKKTERLMGPVAFYEHHLLTYDLHFSTSI